MRFYRVPGVQVVSSHLRLLDTPGINVETFHQKHLQDILEMCEKKHGEWDDFTDQVHEGDQFDTHIVFMFKRITQIMYGGFRDVVYGYMI